MPRSKGRTGKAWRDARIAILAASDVCWWCGHPGADNVDHVIPLSHGGPPLDPGNLRPAHGVNRCPTCRRQCNQDRHRQTPPPGSRRW